jgi:uncharacterized membrane protein
MKRKDTQKIVFTAILIAIMAVMTFVPFIGYIDLVVVTATTIYIPLIIGILVLKDVRYSLLLGFAFGFLSFFKAWVAPESIIDPLFVNPLISIVPRILEALAGHYAFVAVSGIKYKTFSYGFTAFATTLANAVFVLGSLLIIYSVRIAQMAGKNAWAWVSGVFTSVSVIEMLSSIVLTVIITKATDIYMTRFRDK